MIARYSNYSSSKTKNMPAEAILLPPPKKKQFKWPNLHYNVRWTKRIKARVLFAYTFVKRDITFINFLGVYTNYPLSRQSCSNFTTICTLVPYSHDTLLRLFAWNQYTHQIPVLLYALGKLWHRENEW